MYYDTFSGLKSDLDIGKWFVLIRNESEWMTLKINEVKKEDIECLFSPHKNIESSRGVLLQTRLQQSKVSATSSTIELFRCKRL